MKDKSLGSIIREAYLKIRVPSIYLLVIASFVLQFTISSYSPYLTLIPVSLMILQLLFEIHTKVIDEPTSSMFTSFHDSSGQLSKLLKKERSKSSVLDIKVFGISLLHTWTFLDGQLTNFLNEPSGGPINIELTIIDPEWEHTSWLNSTIPNQTVANLELVKDFIVRNKTEMDKKSWNFKVFKYRFTPQKFGIILNDKLLFLGNTVWDNGRLKGGHNSVELVSAEVDAYNRQRIADFIGWFEASKMKIVEFENEN